MLHQQRFGAATSFGMTFENFGAAVCGRMQLRLGGETDGPTSATLRGSEAPPNVLNARIGA